MGRGSTWADLPVADDELAQRAARGDDEAFAELAGRYTMPLARYAGRLLGDRALGRAVANAALEHARRALRVGEPPASVRPWLYRITLTAALAGRRWLEAPGSHCRAGDSRGRVAARARVEILAAGAAVACAIAVSLVTWQGPSGPERPDLSGVASTLAGRAL